MVGSDHTQRVPAIRNDFWCTRSVTYCCERARERESERERERERARERESERARERESERARERESERARERESERARERESERARARERERERQSNGKMFLNITSFSYVLLTLVIMKYWISKQPLSLFGNGGEFTRNCPRRISVDIVIGVQALPTIHHNQAMRRLAANPQCVQDLPSKLPIDEESNYHTPSKGLAHVRKSVHFFLQHKGYMTMMVITVLGIVMPLYMASSITQKPTTSAIRRSSPRNNLPTSVRSIHCCQTMTIKTYPKSTV
jgi:hypothetical protein